jgi:hypothetical protein
VPIVGVHNCQCSAVALRACRLPLHAASTPVGSASPSHCATGPRRTPSPPWTSPEGAADPPYPRAWRLGSPPWTPCIHLLLLSPSLRRLPPPHTSIAPLLPSWISPRHSRLPPRLAPPPLSSPPPPRSLPLAPPPSLPHIDPLPPDLIGRPRGRGDVRHRPAPRVGMLRIRRWTS